MSNFHLHTKTFKLCLNKFKQNDYSQITRFHNLCRLCGTHSSTKDPREWKMFSGRILILLSCSDLGIKIERTNFNVTFQWDYTTIFSLVWKASKNSRWAVKQPDDNEIVLFLLHFPSYSSIKGKLTLSAEILISPRKSHLRYIWHFPTSITKENGTS